MLVEHRFAECDVQQRIETWIAVLGKIVVQRLAAAECTQRQRDHAQRILGQIHLAFIGATESGFRVGGLAGRQFAVEDVAEGADRSEEHTSELQSLMRISYAVFCLKKKKNTIYDVK